MHILFQKSTGNHDITVYDTTELYGEKGSFRVLQFSGEAFQGVLDRNRPERIVFEYPRAMMHLMEANDPAFEDVFVIGHGIGTIAGHYPEKRFWVAELDGLVVELSREYFGYRMDNVTIGDGRLLLEGERPRSRDYILLDAFTGRGTPHHLVTREFFRMTREKLDARGSVLLNLMGKGEHDRMIDAIHSTLGDAFAHTKAFALPSAGAAELRNVILMGSHRPIVFQARHMAGFKEFQPGPGHILKDRQAGSPGPD